MSVFLTPPGGENEEWLAPNEAVQLICDRLQTSIGHARAIVERAIESREVRMHANTKMTNAEISGIDSLDEVYIKRAEDYVLKIKRAVCMPSKKDLLSWLDRHVLDRQAPPAALPKPKGRKQAQQRHTLQKRQIAAAINAVYKGSPPPFLVQTIAKIADELEEWLQNEYEPSPSGSSIKAYLRKIREVR
jgi:hypothetical protein